MNCCRAFLLLALALPLTALAQRADTSEAALARTPHFALTGVLDARPGAFVYRFDAPGWPEALSLQGLPPLYTTLSVGGVPFDDLVTGQPRFDLLPLAWIDSLGVSGAAVQAPLRRYEAPRPTTEARYLSGPDGFQSIEAVHAQGRRRALLGEAGVVRYVFGYAGRAADNEYSNSRLTRGRGTLVALGFDGVRTDVELYNLHTRVKVGAPDGVVPAVPGDPSSIYDRFNATVNNLAANRRTLRNDLGLRVARGFLTAHLYRSFERFTYNAADTSTTARGTRYGVNGSFGMGRRSLDVSAWRLGAAPAARPRSSHARIEAGLRDTLGNVAVYAGAAYDGTLRPVGALHVRFPVVELGATASLHTPPPAIADGFGAYVRETDTGSPFVVTAYARATISRGALDLSARPFATLVTGGYDLVETGRDTLDALDREVRRAGVSLLAGWRTREPLGLYAQAQATATADLSTDLRRDHPALTADARAGLRADLFQRDLRLDLYARVQAWSAFDGRVLHDPTGLLVLAPTAQRVPASATLDVTALMRVRVATLFLSYENALSGTVLMRGNLLVPAQPLAAQRLRFGVFWPILD